MTAIASTQGAATTLAWVMWVIGAMLISASMGTGKLDA